MKDLLRHALDPGVLASSAKASLVVGTLLNAINQGGPLIDGAPLDLGRALLNYVVPFCVATYGAVKALATPPRGDAGAEVEDGNEMG